MLNSKLLPKIIVCPETSKFWFILNSQPHVKENRHFIEYHSGGSKFWYLNGKLHREDGPAVEFSDGHKQWLLNGSLHREDGPAIEFSNGSKFWYLNGKELSEKEFHDVKL